MKGEGGRGKGGEYNREEKKERGGIKFDLMVVSQNGE